MRKRVFTSAFNNGNAAGKMVAGYYKGLGKVVGGLVSKSTIDAAKMAVVIKLMQLNNNDIDNNNE